MGGPWVFEDCALKGARLVVLRLTYPTANVTVNKCTLGGLNGFDSDAEAWQTDLVGGLYTWEEGGRGLKAWEGFDKDLRAHI
eukprot:CAMPEP_0179406500 /NCGR_PEP_ID=MMETSP0799-20121207/926_1 /TAXON_ID=46947 /ORGANISM="Geminigera cryophila, Strain CCMP2564" /LENGTH=81 /DNA_ID=CAMNT_0021177565 /DNA_START=65 /DNA_END=307 /DNA_ORIENTATION=-